MGDGRLAEAGFRFRLVELLDEPVHLVVDSFGGRGLEVDAGRSPDGAAGDYAWDQAVVAPPADREVDGIRVREQQAVPLVQAFRRQRFPVVGGHVGRDEGDAGFATLALNGMPGLTSDATPDGYADAPWVWVFSFDAAAAHSGFRGVPHCGFIGGQEVSREDLPDDMGLPVDWLGPADP